MSEQICHLDFKQKLCFLVCNFFVVGKLFYHRPLSFQYVFRKFLGFTLWTRLRTKDNPNCPWYQKNLDNMTIVRSVEKKCRNIKYQNLNNLNSWTFAPELRKKKKKGSRKWGREYHNKKAVEQLETNLGNLTVSVQMHAPSL